MWKPPRLLRRLVIGPFVLFPAGSAWAGLVSGGVQSSGGGLVFLRKTFPGGGAEQLTDEPDDGLVALDRIPDEAKESEFIHEAAAESFSVDEVEAQHIGSSRGLSKPGGFAVDAGAAAIRSGPLQTASQFDTTGSSGTVAAAAAVQANTFWETLAGMPRSVLLYFGIVDFEGLTAETAELFWLLAYLRLTFALFVNAPGTWPFSWQSLLLFWVVHLCRLPCQALKMSRWNEIGPRADVFLFLLSSLSTFLVCWQRRRSFVLLECDDERTAADARGKETLFGKGLVPLLGGLWLAQRPRLAQRLGWAGGFLALPCLVFAVGLIIRSFTPEDVLLDDAAENLSPFGASMHMAADSLALLPQLVFLARAAAAQRARGGVVSGPEDKSRFVDPKLAVPWLLWMVGARILAFASGVAAVAAEAPQRWNPVEVFYSLGQLFNVLLISDTFLHLTKVFILGPRKVDLFLV